MAIHLDELQPTLDDLHERVEAAKAYLHLDDKRKQIKEMEAASAAPDFWDDSEKAQEHMQQLNRIKNIVGPWEKLSGDVNDALELLEMAEDDPDMLQQLADQAADYQKRLDHLETRALMSEPEDMNDAYLHIHAGAGGTESCDWAAMLLRMYTRWLERNQYGYEQIEITEGEEAGIRSVTLLVKGEYAYGQLKAETGIHRLVRISPFDANKRRHTSFVSLYVWPVVDDSIDVDIRDEDLKVDTYRASGAGGQHVNKTSSAVRITHLPTKLVVQCQNERSQHQNRAQAMKMLTARLYQLYLEERKAEQEAKATEKKDIAWGSQIRSYVFQPYQMVKDHRTGSETGNIQAVMDGDIDDFIEAYLRWSAGMTDGQKGKAGAASGAE